MCSAEDLSCSRLRAKATLIHRGRWHVPLWQEKNISHCFALNLRLGDSTCASYHQSQADVNFYIKIIYPSASLYKVCSKKKHICPMALESLLSAGKGKLSPAPLRLHRPEKGSFWFKWMEPWSGPRSLDTTQHAMTSQSTTEHVFLWGTKGGFRNLGRDGTNWGTVVKKGAHL